MPHTFLIADLAGFTALTEAHGDEAAADTAEAFIAGMRELLDAHEAEEVKTMGDAVLVHVRDAELALCLAVCAIGELGDRHGALGVRVGMHTGPAVRRSGDWFGATVNIAARITAEAEVDQALLSRPTLEAAGDRGRPRAFTWLGERRLRNVSAPVELFALERPRTGDDRGGLVRDPVCRMAVDPSDAAASVERDGHLVHFCSRECAGLFARDPAVYAPRVALH